MAVKKNVCSVTVLPSIQPVCTTEGRLNFVLILGSLAFDPNLSFSVSGKTDARI